MKKAHLLGVTFVFLVMAVTGAAAQTGVVTTTNAVSVPNPVPDTCTGEDVAYNGTIELVTETWWDANGAQHVRGKVPNINVSGLGQTFGLEYQVMAGGGQVEMTSADKPPYDVTLVFRFALSGAGPLPNERILTLFHMTVNADGTTAVEVEPGVDHPLEFVPTCTGK